MCIKAFSNRAAAVGVFVVFGEISVPPQLNSKIQHDRLQSGNKKVHRPVKWMASFDLFSCPDCKVNLKLGVKRRHFNFFFAGHCSLAKIDIGPLRLLSYTE